MQNGKKEYSAPTVLVVSLPSCDVITTSGAVELPVIPADSSDAGLFDLG